METTHREWDVNTPDQRRDGTGTSSLTWVDERGGRVLRTRRQPFRSNAIGARAENYGTKMLFPVEERRRFAEALPSDEQGR